MCSTSSPHRSVAHPVSGCRSQVCWTLAWSHWMTSCGWIILIFKGHLLCPFLQYWSWVSPECVCEVSAQTTPQIIYYNSWKISFCEVCLKNSWFGVYGFKFIWAAYSRPVSRRGRRVYVSLHYISTAINSQYKKHNRERENRVWLYIWEAKCTESGTKQRDITELTPHWPVISADQCTEPRDRATELILRYEWRELISKAWRWSVKNT